MNTENTRDDAAAARQARFGSLPEHIRYEDMIEVRPASTRTGRDAYDPEGSWQSFSCVAVDLGFAL